MPGRAGAPHVIGAPGPNRSWPMQSIAAVQLRQTGYSCIIPHSCQRNGGSARGIPVTEAVA